MVKTDIVEGHATFEDLLYWMTERQRIWDLRQTGVPKPWSSDPIFQEYKFTNVYRELDKGTLALRRMLKGHENDPIGLIPNIIWYRMLNRYEHAKDIGWCDTYKEFEKRILAKEASGSKIWTSAHMTTGGGLGYTKLEYHLESLEEIWHEGSSILAVCEEYLSLESTFQFLRQFQCIGSFISYEIVSDFRWYEELLGKAMDKLTWANIGPGCARGLLRLGMPKHLSSLIKLYNDTTSLPTFWNIACSEAPFELREIEHSLCEFDKYQRVKTGAGRPRQKFNGGAE